MQNLNTNQKYVVNPAYKFKGDYLNVIITNNNPARYELEKNDDEITTTFAWRTHPDLAYLLSFFDGARTVDEVVEAFSAQMKTDSQTIIRAVTPCICNKEPVQIPVRQQYWVPVPKNFLIPNTNGIVRNDLLEKVDIPFIRQHFDLSEVRLRVPNSMTLMLNTNCMTDCVYCYADRRTIRNPLPFSRMKPLLKEAYDLGMPNVDVDGGDFFLYPHWRELIAEMRPYDYLPDISTKHPLSKEIVTDLKKLKVWHLQLSIDSVDSMEIQQLLHVDNTYVNKVLDGLRLLEEAGIEVTVKAVVTRYNDSEKSINKTIDVLTGFHNIRRINFKPADFSQFKPSTYFSTITQLERLKAIVEQRSRTCKTALNFLGYEERKTVERRQQDHPHRPMCTGNVQGFFVLPDGKVTLCEQLYWHPFFILGDLKRQSIMEMWHSEEALSVWNFQQNEVRDESPCKRCDIFNECRRKLGNCWRKAITAYGPGNYDFPSPDCPKAPPVAKDYYIL